MCTHAAARAQDEWMRAHSIDNNPPTHVHNHERRHLSLKKDEVMGSEEDDRTKGIDSVTADPVRRHF